MFVLVELLGLSTDTAGLDVVTTGLGELVLVGIFKLFGFSWLTDFDLKSKSKILEKVHI